MRLLFLQEHYLNDLRIVEFGIPLRGNWECLINRLWSASISRWYIYCGTSKMEALNSKHWHVDFCASTICASEGREDMLLITLIVKLLVGSP